MLPTDVNRIEDSIGSIVASIPPQLSAYLKSEFEKFLPKLMGKKVKAEAHLVIDASQAIAELIGYVKKGKSTVIELAKEPFLKLYAPEKIDSEIEEHIDEVAKKKGIDAGKLRDVWKNVLRPLGHIGESSEIIAQFRGFATMVARDPEDAPYVALSFTTEMHGIVTKDKDISDQPEVRTWRVSNVARTITLLKQGSFSFFISARLLVPLLQAVFEMVITFLAALFEFAVKIGRLFVALAERFVEGLGGLPDWAQLLLLVAGIALVAYEKTRNEIIGSIRVAIRMASEFLASLYEAARQIIEPLAPLVEVGIVIVQLILGGIGKSIAELQSL